MSRARNRLLSRTPLIPTPQGRADGTVRGGLVAVAGAISMLVASACAPSDQTAAAADSTPTFTKVAEESFRYPEPVSAVADIAPPNGEGAPWHIVGSVLDPGSGRTRSAVWQSEGGRNWTHHEVPPADRGTSEEMRAVTHAGDGLLAVGSVGVGDDANAVVWKSSGEEDASWTQVAPPEMSDRHEQWAFDVAASDRGIVVAGGERAWGDVRPRIWYSTDGDEWQTVDGGAGGPFDTTGQESVTAVTAFSDGFVAVGWERVDGEQNGLAWYSADGTNWEQVEAPAMEGDGRQAVLSVTATEGTVIAGGYTVDGSGQGQPVVWRSGDGIEWNGPSDHLPLEDGRLTTANDLMVQSLTVYDDDGDQTVLAAGGARARPHLWRSTNAGQTWSMLPRPGSAHFPDGVDLIGAASDGSDMVAVGAEPLVLSLDDSRWLNASGDAFPDGGRKPVAMSAVIDDDVTLIGGYQVAAEHGGKPQQHYEAHVWRREGDGSFEMIGPAEDEAEAFVQGFDTGAIEAMSVFGEGYVAVGVENFSIAETRLSGNPSPDGMLWISEDGQHWVRYAATTSTFDLDQFADLYTDYLDHHSPEEISGAIVGTAGDDPLVTEPPAGGPGTRSLRGVAALGDDGFITVGSSFHDDNIDPIVAIRAGDNTISGEDSGLAGGGTQRLNDVCRAPGSVIAVGITGSDGRYDPAILHRDGGNWQQATATDDSFESRGSRQAVACAASDEGFIAVGWDDSGGNRNAKVWLSDDGQTWEELTSGMLGGSGDQEATAVAAVPGGGWLIAGTDTSGEDAGVALWRLAPNGDLSRRDIGEPVLSGPLPMTVSDIAVSEDRTVIVGADVDGIGVWETATDDLDR